MGALSQLGVEYSHPGLRAIREGLEQGVQHNVDGAHLPTVMCPIRPLVLY